MKDSRAITEQDRADLVSAILTCGDDAVLIPHGTYSMPETGRYLLRSLVAKDLARPVILVGALTPLFEAQSDAPANLELALAAALEPRPGVWLSMSGELWHPERVEKGLATGQFVAA